MTNDDDDEPSGLSRFARAALLLVLVGVGGFWALSVRSSRISAEQVGNEARAVEVLRLLVRAQGEFREQDKDGDGKTQYGTLQQLQAAGLIDSKTGSGTASGYRFELLVSARNPEFEWYAVANPEVAGALIPLPWESAPTPTGGVAYVVNQEGTVFFTPMTAAAAAQTLRADCKVPPGLQPTGR